MNMETGNLDNQSALLSSLNPEQREAVLATEGYVRIVAGAGSGKTKALTHRFAWLVKELGVSPNEILCVTFTNKAAREMRERVDSLLGEPLKNHFIMTFHQFCLRMLRSEIHRLEWPSSFHILDADDQKKLMSQICKELEISAKEGTENLRILDQAKRSPNWEQIVESMTCGNKPQMPRDSSVEEMVQWRYLHHQVELKSMDFNDMISFALFLLKRYPEVRQQWSNRFRYIMVDETQDNNHRQWEMLKYLSEAHNNLFVVGDPDQSIYSFRGARPQMLVDFESMFSPCRTVILNRNYRSTPHILQAANDIIAHNRMRVKKDLYTNHADKGELIRAYNTSSEVQEAEYIAREIQNMIKEGRQPADFAVLFRLSASTRSIEEGLIRHGIAYRIYGGQRFFERAEVKNTLAYVNLLADPNDDMAFLRIFNYPSRKLGDSFILTLQTIANSYNLSLLEALKQFHGQIKALKRPGSVQFLQLMEHLQEIRENQDLDQLFSHIIKDTGIYQQLLKDDEPERIDNLQELEHAVQNYILQHENSNDLTQYLQDISLYTNLDTDDKEENVVKLMTIHQSKGLEFPVVFVAGFSEGQLPCKRSIESKHPDALEEERRLAYVAITRAEERLYLTFNTEFGWDGRVRLPSRFLSEIDKKRVVFITDPQHTEGNEIANLVWRRGFDDVSDDE